MDEVEAALDDVNLHRFLGLIDEFRQRGPAPHREPPEAHDGGGRLAATASRCSPAARRRWSPSGSAPPPARRRRRLGRALRKPSLYRIRGSPIVPDLPPRHGFRVREWTTESEGSSGRGVSDAKPARGRAAGQRHARRFGEVVAVDDIDLDIADGEFFSLLGPSGSGKTTMLRMIAGFELPTAGAILLARRRRHPPAAVRPRRQHGVPGLRAVPAHDAWSRTSSTA